MAQAVGLTFQQLQKYERGNNRVRYLGIEVDDALEMSEQIDL